MRSRGRRPPPRRRRSRAPLYGALLIAIALIVVLVRSLGGDGKEPRKRLQGVNRMQTAIAISNDSFPVKGSAGAVVLVRADEFPDGLPGSALAIAKNAPVLLTVPNQLFFRTEEEIRRVLKRGRTVYLLGGTAALNEEVESEIKGMGYVVQRYAGANRFATAVAVAEGLGDPDLLLIADGTKFPDGLTAGAAAGKVGGAVLFTRGPTMPAETAAYIASRPGAPRVAIGGPAAAADPSASPVVGRDRYETATKVAGQFFINPPAVGVATGTDFPDGLAGGAHIARKGGPLLLTNPVELPPGVRAYLERNRSSIGASFVYGGTRAVTDQVQAAIRSAIA